MTLDQAIVFALLAAALAGFILQPVRYDIVALLLLLSLVIFGFVRPAEAFGGFSQPAVITVAAVFAISRGLQTAGAVDLLVRLVAPLKGRPNAQIAAQAGIVTGLSGFMNNIGALALVMPVALRNAAREGYSPARALMPLAFGSLLGGTITLIGTPPNLIVSGLRAQNTDLGHFDLFAFAWVGLPLALIGVVVMLLLAPILLPKERVAGSAAGASAAATVGDYVAEAIVGPTSRAAGLTVRALESLVDGNTVVVGLFRGEESILAPDGSMHIEPGDALLIEGPPDAIKALVTAAGLALDTGEAHKSALLASPKVSVIEVIVRPGSELIGRSPTLMRLRLNHGVNVLAVSRHGRRVEQRMAHLKIRPGDVLLLQARVERLPEAMVALGLLPLADRQVTLGQPRRAALAAGLFAVGILVVLFDLAPSVVAFPAVVAAMLVFRVMKPEEAYGSVEWSVLVLLGALFPLGIALERTGAIALVVAALAEPAGALPAWMVVAGLILACMMLSEVMANAACVLIMGPLALGLAPQVGLTPDAALMAVSIGTSCTFLSPIGHQSNTVVMEAGGYRFSDYARFGFPVSLTCLVIATPLVVWIWN